ncbi:WGR domain-containing protein [bacterium]|nr:MAG: WGR domain-containing protein [bacterium]
MSDVVKHVRYVMSNIDNNNNKFWYGTHYSDNTVKCEWGRIGAKISSVVKPFCRGYQAEAFLVQKGSEKEKKGYRMLNVVDGATDGGGHGKGDVKVVKQNDLQQVALSQIDTDSKQTASLIKYLTKVNAHNILSSTTMTYDVDSGLFSTPCGIVTQGGIDEANELLVDIGDFVADRKFSASKLKDLTCDYLMLIPQKVGRKLNVEEVFADLTAVQKQKAILDSLQASLDSVMAGKGSDADKKEAKKVMEKVFAVKLHLVKDSSVISRITKKYKDTRKDMHVCKNLDIKTVYSVEIEAMKTAFEKVGASMSNIWELWHGSRVSNVLSILKGGLIIPPASSSHCTGRLYGNGVYASDISTKALGYSFGTWGGSKDNNPFMFLVDMAMGNQYFPSRNNYTSTRYPVSGYDSTFAKQGSGVYNNEMIIYKTSQVNIKYLVEFSN